MGACVLDKAQDLLFAAVVMGTCFTLSDQQRQTTAHSTLCPRDIVHNLLANTESCCLGFETVQTEVQDEAQCKRLTRPLELIISSFVQEFEDCGANPTSCAPFRAEFRKCALPADIKHADSFLADPHQARRRQALRRQCVRAMRRADADKGGRQVARRNEPLLQEVIPRFRSLVAAARALFALDPTAAYHPQTNATALLLRRCAGGPTREKSVTAMEADEFSCEDDAIERIEAKVWCLWCL
jgi:hypothetical protein